MVLVLDTRSRGTASRPGEDHCIFFLCKTLCFSPPRSIMNVMVCVCVCVCWGGGSEGKGGALL